MKTTVRSRGRIRLRSTRRSLAAAAATVGVMALLLTTLTPAAGAAIAGGDTKVDAALAAGDATASSGSVNLVVKPGTGIETGGSVTVSGSGYEGTKTLYVAICAINGAVPGTLTNCLGGAVPGGNTTQAWGYITPDGSKPTNGGSVTGSWGPGASFSVTLQLPAASGSLNCVPSACAVFTTYGGSDTDGNISVPIGFASPDGTSTPATSSATPTTTSQATTSPTSTSTSTTPTTSSTTIAPPSTVQPESILADSVVAGGAQQVLFAGFTPGEKVAVTLFSTPIPLPAVIADPAGIVKINFTVPATLPAGTHLIQAIGAQSGTIGIAQFTVTAPIVTTASTTTAPATTSSSVATTTSSAAPTTTSSVPVSSASTTSAPAPVTTAAAVNSGRRPVWPWFVLGAILIACVIVGIVLYRRRRAELADEEQERERLLAEAAADEHARSAAPTTYLPSYPGSDLTDGEHGLLSGRDHPDNPGLLAGQGYIPPSSADQPTTAIPIHQDPPTTYLPPTLDRSGSHRAPDEQPGGSLFGGTAAPSGPADDGGPGTAQWRPDFGSPENDSDDGGPGTVQWRPDFGDDPDHPGGR